MASTHLSHYFKKQWWCKPPESKDNSPLTGTDTWRKPKFRPGHWVLFYDEISMELYVGKVAYVVYESGSLKRYEIKVHYSYYGVYPNCMKARMLPQENDEVGE